MARAAQAGVGAAQVGAAEVGAAEVEADHNSRVDDEGVYECDESVASCSGRGTCRGGARGAVRQETLMSGTTVTTTTRRRRPSITAIVTAIAIMMLVVHIPPLR